MWGVWGICCFHEEEGIGVFFVYRGVGDEYEGQVGLCVCCVCGFFCVGEWVCGVCCGCVCVGVWCVVCVVCVCGVWGGVCLVWVGCVVGRVGVLLGVLVVVQLGWRSTMHGVLRRVFCTRTSRI